MRAKLVSMPLHMSSLEDNLQEANQEGYWNDLATADGILQAAQAQLQRSELEDVRMEPSLGKESNQIIRIINLVQKKLRKAIHNKPDNERQVQDAFEALLIGADVDFSRETDTISYSSKSYVPDFTVAALSLAIEVKFCGKEAREKSIIAEINDDILAYQTKYKNLIFAVYDLGNIRDVERFAEAFTKNDNVVVEVVKH